MNDAARILLMGKSRFKPPAGLPILPMRLTGINSDGSATTDRNAAEAFRNAGYFRFDPTIIDVGNSSALTTALRTTASGSHIRMTASITMDPTDLRSTDASQAGGMLGKLVDTNGYTLTLRVTGPDLTTQTFTVDGVYGNVWNTTLTLSGSAALQRVFRTDSLDAEGEPTPFWKVTTSKADLNAYAGDAYFISGTALSVRLATAGSVEAFKANLKALYTGSAGTSRILVSGAPLCLYGNGSNVVLDGVQIVGLDASSRAPVFFAHNMRQTYAVGKGADLTQCGMHILSSCLVYGSESDGANAFATSAQMKGLVQTVNSRFIRNGDTRTFAANGTLQGLSAHGGSNHVSFGSEFNLNNGQGVADTCAASKSDISWLVSCDVTGGQTTAANYEFGSAAANCNRLAYLDSCTSSSAPAAGDLVIGSNAAVYARNTSLPNVSGGTVLAY